MRRVYFHRDYHGFTGGHLKVWDYFSHVDAAEGYRAEIYFTPLSIWAEHNPWFLSGGRILSEWRPYLGDIVFLAGFDRESITVSERDHFPRPIINLVQGLSHSDPQDAKFGYVGHRAIRICCSPETADALRATGRANGPIFTVPNGIDTRLLPVPAPRAARRFDLLIVGLKAPLLAGELAGALNLQYPSMRLLILTEPLPRSAFLEALGAARTALLLPQPKEGFYLPALEAMMLRTIVVCPDVGGNRSFCRDGATAIVPSQYDLSALLAAVKRAIAHDGPAREALIARAAAIAGSYCLLRERVAFHAILNEIDQIW